MSNPIKTIALAQVAWDEGRYVDCGRTIYENLSPRARVGWASGILRFCVQHSPSAPPVDAVLALANNEGAWSQAHDAFSKVRALTLHAERTPEEFDPRLIRLLFVAEITAKVIYNASGAPAPFDQNAGWWLPKCLQDLLSIVPGPRVNVAAQKVVLQSIVAENAA